MRDLLLFKRMVTPIIIQALFWLFIVIILVSAVVSIMRHDFVIGIATLFAGPLVVRVACEMIIVFFRINDNLAEMRNKNIQ